VKLSKSGLGKIAVEFASVVFAVLLALGLNHWREGVINEQMAHDSLIRIRQEVKDNIEELDSAFVSFEEGLKVIRDQKEALDSLGEIDGLDWGYSHPVLSIDAWKTATLTNAVVYMDPEIVADLADIYQIQEMYMQFGFKFFDRMPELALYRDDLEMLIEILEMHYNISNSLARSLHNGYQSFLEAHEDYFKDF